MKWSKTKEEIRANDSWQVQRVYSELVLGFDKLTDIGPSISIFGSARIKCDSIYYKMAEEISEILSNKGFNILTGGGPGIMEAANKGAQKGKGYSVGLGIKLPFEAQNNSFIHAGHNLTFNYFHVRKVMLIKYSQGFIVFPGGVGTMDELFEVITLNQCKKNEEFPIFLVGSEYWNGLLSWMKTSMLSEGCVKESDFDAFRVVDSVDEVVTSFDKFFLKYRKENKLNI